MQTVRSQHVESVLNYWFGPLDAAGVPLTARSRLWFRSSREQDQYISDTFGELVSQALTGGLTEWEETPDGRMALIVLLDQFTRNIYRRSSRAFAGDKRALLLCQQGIRLGHDVSLPLIQRAFFYMPLEHAENIECQHEAVRQISALRDSAPQSALTLMQGFVESALEHKLIVEQFGRYPHRNLTLGRVNTEAETQWLTDSGRRFGQ